MPTSKQTRARKPLKKRTAPAVALNRLVSGFLRELIAYMDHDCESWGVQCVVKKSEVTGTRQDCDVWGHTYVDQKTGHLGDDFYGYTYIPLGRGDYAKISYSC